MTTMTSVKASIIAAVALIAGVTPLFKDAEGDEALVANTSRLSQLLQHEALPLDELCAWAVNWIRQDGRLLNKPTKFEVRDGN